MPILFVLKQNNWIIIRFFTFASKLVFDVSHGNLYLSDGIQ